MVSYPRLPTLALAVTLAATTTLDQLPAQTASPPSLAGTWQLEAVENIAPDGSRIALYGPTPQGLLILDPRGIYSLQIMQNDRPRFADNDRLRGSDVEVRSAFEGFNAHFGHYAVDWARHTLTFQIEHASYPNWEGVTQVRPFAVEGDRLTYTVPSPTTGAKVTGEVRWQRVRR